MLEDPKKLVDFLSWPIEKVAEKVRLEQRPKVGIFVPDGSRRLVLAFTDWKPDTQAFYEACATEGAKYLLNNLEVFFSHGLPILFVPIMSRSMLDRDKEQREPKYQKYTLLKGFETIFTSDQWLHFYEQYDVRVKVYGEPAKCLEGTVCEPALDWFDRACQNTAHHQTHTLFYGIGESKWLALDVALRGIRSCHQIENELPRDAISAYYGEDIDAPADFYIMTSKLSGLGALPSFLVNGDTEVYFMPNAMGMCPDEKLEMCERAYRSILYDLLFVRSRLREGISAFDVNPEIRAALRARYEQLAGRVIGLGEEIGGVWLPID